MSSTPFYVYRICLIATFGGLLFGYDTAVISGAVDPLRIHFTLSALELGWVVGSALIGCILGVLVAGKLSDWTGRKVVLLLSAAMFLASALWCGLARSADELVIARILGGVGVGMASLMSPLYIAELSPAKIRGALVSLNQLAILGGMVLSYLINAWVASFGDAAWLNETGWRWMLGLMAVPSGVFFLLALTIPESPRWLIKKGRSEDARKILLHINNDEAVVDQEIRDIHNTIEHEQAKMSELLKPGVRGIFIIMSILAFFQAITGINVVMYYAPTIFTSAGIGTGAALSHSVIIGVVMMVFTILSMVIIDRLGRKPLMTWAAAGMAIALGLLGFGFTQDGSAGWSLLVWILLYVAAFAVGMGGVFWVIVTEIFPTRVRGVASSLAVVFLWGGNFLVSQFFPYMLEALKGRVFYVFAAACVVCFFFILRFVPETKGKSLEQIEKDLFNV